MTRKLSSKKSRHGVRAAGKTQTSITLREAVLQRARAVARADGRSFSNWLEKLLIDKLKIAIEP